MERRKSEMWNYFTLKSQKVVQCNVCKTDLAYSGGTGSMNNHLRAKHPSAVLSASGKLLQLAMHSVTNMLGSDYKYLILRWRNLAPHFNSFIINKILIVNGNGYKIC
jgi:BED zinc finger